MKYKVNGVTTLQIDETVHIEAVSPKDAFRLAIEHMKKKYGSKFTGFGLAADRATAEEIETGKKSFMLCFSDRPPIWYEEYKP